MTYVFLFFCFLLFFTFLISFCLFLIVFYVPNRKKRDPAAIDLPSGKIYEPFHEQMKKWVIDSRAMPHQDFSIKSADGLTLCGKYYEYAPGAPIELMFHGYRGNAERDLSGGVDRCFQVGHNAFIVDQRCSGRSEGHVITFGILEHLDCITWIHFLISQFGLDCKIILTGISMGASTVLMAAGKELPSNVIGVLADCGFHSAKDVILCVACSMHLPARFLYPFVKLGARLYGHFDLESYSPVEAVRNCKIPVLFFHGADDDYVPFYMSQTNFVACASRKNLCIIPHAGHGLSYPVSPERYIAEVNNFFHNLE